MNSIQQSLRRGFSLIETMIVIAIIVAFMGVAVPNIMGALEKNKVSSTKTSLHGYKQAIDMFYADTASYPTDLNDLIEKPADERIAAKWANPYMDKLPQDGWSHDFQYEKTPQAAHPYNLYSFGPNGEDGAEEEHLSVWE